MTFIDETTNVSAEYRHRQLRTDSELNEPSNKRRPPILPSTSDAGLFLPHFSDSQAVFAEFDSNTVVNYDQPIPDGNARASDPIVDDFGAVGPSGHTPVSLINFDPHVTSIDNNHLITPPKVHNTRTFSAHDFSSPQDIISPASVRSHGALQLYGARMLLPFKVPQEAILFQYYMENLAAQVQLSGTTTY